MATISDVARLARVSKTTVSRVLTNSRQVRESSKQAVLAAAKELNYTPSEIARSLATQSTGCIGFICSDMANLRTPKLLNALESSARRIGKHILPVCSNQQSSEEKKCFDFLLSKQCEAIILDSHILSNRDLHDLARKPGMPPIILFDRNIKADDLFRHAQRFDYREAISSACRFLIAKKHRHIALIADKDRKNLLKDGMEHALFTRGLPVNPLLQITHATHGSQAIQQLLNQPISFTAVITSNALQAAQAIKMLNAYDKRVPDDISVISLEDSVLAENMIPSITAINIPTETMAEQIIASVIELDGTLPVIHDMEVDEMHQGNLIIRDSVRNLDR